MRLKVKELFSFLVALAFLAMSFTGIARASYVQEWEKPVKVSSKTGIKAQVCKSGDNVFVAFAKAGDAIYVQLVSPSGERLWGNDGKKILTRGTNPSELVAICLPGGGFFVAALEGGQIYYQLVDANGNPQLGVDADHLLGYEALGSSNADESLSAVALSDNLVAVGYKDGSGYGRVFFVDLPDGFLKEVYSCSDATVCTVSNNDTEQIKVVPLDAHKAWVVVDNGTLMVNIIEDNGQRSGLQVLDNETDPDSFYVFSDGEGGLIATYNDTTKTYVAVMHPDLTKKKKKVINSSALQGAALTTDGYLALAIDDGLNKYYLDNIRLGNPVWESSINLSGTNQLKLAGLSGGAIGYSWIDSSGKIKIQVVDVVDGVPTNLLGDGHSPSDDFAASENVAVLPGSLYAIYGNGTSDNEYFIYKLNYSALVDLEISFNGTPPSVEISSEEEKEVSFDSDDNITNVGEKGANDISLKFYLVCDSLTDNSSKPKDLLNSFEDADCKVLVHEASFDINAHESLNLGDILFGNPVKISPDEANQFFTCCDNCSSAQLVVIVNEGQGIAEANYDDENLANATATPAAYPELTVGIQENDGHDNPFVEEEVELGGTLHIRGGMVKVSNTGNATAENVKVAFNLVCSDSCEGRANIDIIPLGTQTIEEIAARDFYTFDELEFQVPSEADFDGPSACCVLQVKVDPDNEIGECNNKFDCDSEGVSDPVFDNCTACDTETTTNDNEADTGCFTSSGLAGGSKSITVTNPYYLPDLVPSRGEAWMGVYGLWYDIVILNNGTADSPDYGVVLYASDDDQLDEGDTFLEGSTRDGLDAGESEELMALISGVEAPNYLIVCVDKLNVIEELNEDNNCLAIQVSQEEPACDAEHLDLCTDEVSCVEAGGYWCDGACQAEPCEIQPPSWNVDCTVDEAGYAHFLVTIMDCGSLCGQNVKVEVAATDPDDLAIDYSWLPDLGWTSGEQAFTFAGFGPVTMVDLLAGTGVTGEMVSGWYAGVMIDVNGDNVFDYNTELRHCQFPVVSESECAQYQDSVLCVAHGCVWNYDTNSCEAAE